MKKLYVVYASEGLRHERVYFETYEQAVRAAGRFFDCLGYRSVSIFDRVADRCIYHEENNSLYLAPGYKEVNA